MFKPKTVAFTLSERDYSWGSYVSFAGRSHAKQQSDVVDKKNKLMTYCLVYILNRIFRNFFDLS